MTINEWLKQNPDLKWEFQKENKSKYLRNNLKVYFSMKKNDPREKELTALCRDRGLPYSLCPVRGGGYFVFVTPSVLS